MTNALETATTVAKPVVTAVAKDLALSAASTAGAVAGALVVLGTYGFVTTKLAERKAAKTLAQEEN